MRPRALPLTAILLAFLATTYLWNPTAQAQAAAGYRPVQPGDAGTAYSWQRQISLSGDGVTRTNAVVKILVPSTFDYTHSKQNGTDLAFYEDNGAGGWSRLEHYVHDWVPGGESTVFVKVTIPSSGKTIYMRYGNGDQWRSFSNCYKTMPVCDTGGIGMYQDPNPGCASGCTHRGLGFNTTAGSFDSSVVAEPDIWYENGIFYTPFRGSGGSVPQIGTATSTDGITWTKNANDPICLDLNANSNCADDWAAYPCMLRHAGAWWLWFVHESGGGGSTSAMYLAKNTGDFNTTTGWVLQNGGNPVLTLATSSWESAGITNCSVVVKENSPGVFKFYMSYEAARGGSCGSSHWGIGFATSTDGVSWTKLTTGSCSAASGPKLFPANDACVTTACPWDGHARANGDLYWVSDGQGTGRWLIAYCGLWYGSTPNSGGRASDTSSDNLIGFAVTDDADWTTSTTWTVLPENPIIIPQFRSQGAGSGGSKVKGNVCDQNFAEAGFRATGGTSFEHKTWALLNDQDYSGYNHLAVGGSSLYELAYLDWPSWSNQSGQTGGGGTIRQGTGYYDHRDASEVGCGGGTPTTRGDGCRFVASSTVLSGDYEVGLRYKWREILPDYWWGLGVNGNGDADDFVNGFASWAVIDQCQSNNCPNERLKIWEATSGASGTWNERAGESTNRATPALGTWTKMYVRAEGSNLRAWRDTNTAATPVVSYASFSRANGNFYGFYIANGRSDGTTAHVSIDNFYIRSIPTGGDPTVTLGSETTPPTPPGAVTTLALTAQCDAIKLDWTAPSNGGTAITGYDVYAQKLEDANGNPTVNTRGIIQSVSGSTLTFTDTFPAQREKWRYDVVAKNAQGESAVGNQPSAIADGTPTSPTSVTATHTVNSITIAWTAPTRTSITGYKIYRDTLPPQSPLPFFQNDPDGASPFTNTGLTAGQSFVYEVAATNTCGDGARSTQVVDTAGSTPGTPGTPVVTAGNAQNALTWTAASDNGFAIDKYEVWSTPDTNGNGVDEESYTKVADVTTTSYMHTGLTNGQGYFYKVRAHNSQGNSSFSNSATGVPSTVPAAPTSVVGAPGDQQVSLTWTAPSDTGGLTLTEYRVYRTIAGTEIYAGSSATTSFTDTGRQNGVSHTYRVSAVNSRGEGAQSASSAAVVPYGVPFAPLNLTATAGNQAVSLNWTAPNDNGRSITNYRVYRSQAGGAFALLATGVTTTSYTDSSPPLTNDVAYSYRVSAVNLGGEGPQSDAASATPTSTPPPPPPTPPPDDETGGGDGGTSTAAGNPSQEAAASGAAWVVSILLLSAGIGAIVAVVRSR